MASYPAKSPDKMGIIGAGSWGTALAILFARNQINTVLWGTRTDELQDMIDQRCNSRYLPGIAFPEALQPVTEFSELLSCNTLLLAVPSHAFHSIVSRLAKEFPQIKRIVCASKGFEDTTNRLLHKIIDQYFPDDVDYAVLSGPTFALEVAKGLPTAVTIASKSKRFAAEMATWVHDENFRAYTSSDVIGVEVGGAVKNILAIAAGIADGLGFGANTRAAMITRGLAEVIRLGTTLGAMPETFMGLAGIGDLVLTCTDDLSRNRRFGLALAQGRTQEQAKNDIGQVVEGIKTCKAVYEMSKDLNVDMPITEQVFQVLYKNSEPKTAVRNLFLRHLKNELE